MQFVEDMKLSLVNKRDFFLHVFEELLAAESEMFMYNDTKTLVWFPAKVRTWIRELRFHYCIINHFTLKQIKIGE